MRCGRRRRAKGRGGGAHHFVDDAHVELVDVVDVVGRLRQQPPQHFDVVDLPDPDGHDVVDFGRIDFDDCDDVFFEQQYVHELHGRVRRGVRPMWRDAQQHAVDGADVLRFRVYLPGVGPDLLLAVPPLTMALASGPMLRAAIAESRISVNASHARVPSSALRTSSEPD
jgi:hypothetical protein